MEVRFDSFLISDEQELLQTDVIIGFLDRAYWTKGRTHEQMLAGVRDSWSFGLYEGDKQIGFARVVTDFATVFYLCDVFLDEAYRGKGLGQRFVGEILGLPKLEALSGILRTSTAHTLYERYGFIREGETFMKRPAKPASP